MTTPRNLEGTVLKDTYRLKRAIGHGGMAVVYEADHVHLPRKYAIKLFSPTLASSPMLMKRFQREATVTCRLDHPNIVEVSDFGHDRELGPYIVMERLVGENLSRRLARVKRLDLVQACDVVEQVCSALTVAHADGVVHRDLKPGNIFLCGRPEGDEAEVVKLLDFGISQVPDSALTQTNARLGAARYMSPEQAQAQQMDHRTDIFSMGSIIFSMLAGRPPYSGKDELVVMYQIVHEHPRSLRKFRPDLPGELEQVVARALKKAPDDRYQSVEQLSAAFVRAVARADPVFAEASTDPAPEEGEVLSEELTSELADVTVEQVVDAHKATIMEPAAPAVDPHKATIMEPVSAPAVDAHKKTLMEPAAAPAVDPHKKTLMEPAATPGVEPHKETVMDRPAVAPADSRAQTLRRPAEAAPADHLETLRDVPVPDLRMTVKEQAVVVAPAGIAGDLPTMAPLDPVESTEQIGERSVALPVTLVVGLVLAAAVVFYVAFKGSGQPEPAGTEEAAARAGEGVETPEPVAPATVATKKPAPTTAPSPDAAAVARPAAKVPAPAARRPAKAPAVSVRKATAAPFRGDLAETDKKPTRRPRRVTKKPKRRPEKKPREAPFSGDL